MNESYSKALQTTLTVFFNEYHMATQTQHHKSDVFSHTQLTKRPLNLMMFIVSLSPHCFLAVQ